MPHPVACLDDILVLGMPLRLWVVDAYIAVTIRCLIRVTCVAYDDSIETSISRESKQLQHQGCTYSDTVAALPKCLSLNRHHCNPGV